MLLSIHVYVCWSAQVAVRKKPQTGCLKPQALISHSSEDWKSMIKVPVNSTSGGALFLPCRQLPSHYPYVVFPRGRCRRNCSLVPPPLPIGTLLLLSRFGRVQLCVIP